jgi:3-oxoacyl-[acyl-carrier protein] reductase
MSLEGHVAVVTGAGGEGMGRSIALTLGREGAAVVVNYRNSRDRAETTAHAIEDLGARAIALAADIADPAAVEKMFTSARERFGYIDIVVNSAGAPWKPQDITEITPDHLRDVLAREVEATFHLLRAALPQMRERGWGRFISIGGYMADDWRFGPPDAPLDYPLGKAARHWMTRTMAPPSASPSNKLSKPRGVVWHSRPPLCRVVTRSNVTSAPPPTRVRTGL